MNPYVRFYLKKPDQVVMGSVEATFFNQDYENEGEWTGEANLRLAVGYYNPRHKRAYMYVGACHVTWLPPRELEIRYNNGLAHRSQHTTAKYSGMDENQVRDLVMKMMQKIIDPSNPVYEPLLGQLRSRSYRGVSVDEDIVIEQ